MIVSNHGGRQLDSVPSTARALPIVADAIGGSVEVLADGGVRTGLDVVRLLVLGARAVLLGRAWAVALAASPAFSTCSRSSARTLTLRSGSPVPHPLPNFDRGALYESGS